MYTLSRIQQLTQIYFEGRKVIMKLFQTSHITRIQMIYIYSFKKPTKTLFQQDIIFIERNNVAYLHREFLH